MAIDETIKRKKRYQGLGCALFLVCSVIVMGVISSLSIDRDGGRTSLVRAKSDMRTLATGLQTYYLDWNAYPDVDSLATVLTTPLAYFYEIPKDATSPLRENLLPYHVFGTTQSLIIYGHGPDQDIDLRPTTDFLHPKNDLSVIPVTFDATNGLNSNGDIWRRVNPEELIPFLMSREATPDESPG